MIRQLDVTSPLAHSQQADLISVPSVAKHDEYLSPVRDQDFILFSSRSKVPAEYLIPTSFPPIELFLYHTTFSPNSSKTRKILQSCYDLSCTQSLRSWWIRITRFGYWLGCSSSLSSSLLFAKWIIDSSEINFTSSDAGSTLRGRSLPLHSSTTYLRFSRSIFFLRRTWSSPTKLQSLDIPANLS